MTLGTRIKSALAGLVGKSGSWTRAFSDTGGAGGEVAMTKPLQQSVWVMASVEKIANPISAVSVDLSLDPDFATELEKTPAIKRWMRKPAHGLTWSDFIFASIGWLKCSGETFWLLDDAWMVPHLDALEELPPLVLARPDRMRHVLEAGKIVAWEFRDATGRAYALPPEQVVHLRQWNPYDEHRGLGNLEAAKTAAETEWLAARMYRAIMRDNGDRGSIVIAKSGITDQAQKDQIVAMLRQANAKRRRGEPAPLFLTNDVTIEDPKLFDPSASFWAGRVDTRKEIFAAFGIPLSMADTQASYSIGSASDYFRLIIDTCMPASEKLADGLDYIFTRLQGAYVYTAFDWDEHPVMQEVRKERLGSVDTLWTKGMPLAKCSEYLALGLPRFPGDQVSYLPFAVAPAGSEMHDDPATSPAFGEEEDEDEDEAAADILETDEVQAMLRALSSHGHSQSQIANSKASEGQDGQAFQDGRPPQEIALWKSHERRQQSIRAAYRSKFGKVLYEARKQTLAALASHGKSQLAASRSPATRAPTDFLFNLADFKALLVQTFSSVSADALQQAGASVFAELRLEDAWTAPAPFVQDFLLSRANKLSGVADAVYADIQATLDAGIQAGDTAAQLAGRVKQAFKGVESARAATIAQTETAAAYAKGRHQAMRDAGVTKRSWLTSGNANVRASHRAANGQTVGIDEPFIVDGEPLDHPGDPDGSPGNVINCHCVAIAVE